MLATPTPPVARLARDARVGEALAALPRERFALLSPDRRELSEDSALRLCEDLLLDREARVLVLAPASARLPAVFGRLSREVVVATATAHLAELCDQLAGAGAENVTACTDSLDALHATAAPFDAIVVQHPPMRELPVAVIDMLEPDGRAVVAPDSAWPPRRLVRTTRSAGGALALEELDLATFRPLLGDLLVDAGLVLRQEVVDALRAALVSKRRLGHELMVRGALREDDLYRILAEQQGIPFVETAQVLARIDHELVRRLPRKYLDHYGFLPVHRDGDRIVVVTADVGLPTWELRSAFDDRELAIELTTPTDVKRIWTAIELGLVRRPTAAAAPVVAAAADEIGSAPDDSRAASLFEAVLLDAIAERASDIHLENYDSGARVRFRIDGSLCDIERYRLAPDDFTALVNVIKVVSDLDISERRLPQGGRVRRRARGRMFDLRVQTQPTLHGEGIVIRILPQDQRPPTIEQLGFATATAEHYRRLLKEPSGLVLVVGATGCGKSTTLYAGLQLLAQDTTRKVLTVEDPVEFTLPRIQQTQINAAAGFHFADAMRAFVREDPDVILVGEIRDAETALEAVRAAQTGHLVLSTMHCTDGVDAVQRLLDLGMHANSIASELRAVIAQRLARRICPSCRREAEPDRALLAELFPAGAPADFACWVGAGCQRCKQTGTRGRIAVVELLHVPSELRRAIARREPLDDLRELAQRCGVLSMRDSALRQVQDGVIPMAELYDVLTSEQMRPPAAARAARA